MRGVVIVALLVLAVAGFCLFESDQEGDHHTGPLHICVAMLVASLVPACIVALFVAGSTILLVTPRLTTVSLGVALPPPKFAVSL